MKLVPRVLGLAAWAILAIGIGMFATGRQQAARRFLAQSVGPAAPLHLPAESDYVRQLYGQPLGDRFETIARAAQILHLAGQPEKAQLLTRFFAYCNVERLLGQDDACKRETVRSAVDKAGRLALDAAWSADPELTSRLEHLLSFSFASEQQMHDGFPRFVWNNIHYIAPGVVRYDYGNQLFVLLAVQNRGPWEIVRFRAMAALSGDHRIGLECDSNPSPFYWSHPFTPGTQEIRICSLLEVTTSEALVAAVHRAQLEGPPNVQLDGLELKNPYVWITDAAGDGISRFTLHPVDFIGEMPNAEFPYSHSADLQRELEHTRCESTDTCPSRGQVASLAFYDFFQRRLPLLPFLVGLLMGVGIGGGLVASFRLAGIVTAVVAVGIAGTIALAFHTAANGPPGESRGWALFGLLHLSVYAIGALLLWIPGLFLGFALAKWVRDLSST